MPIGTVTTNLSRTRWSVPKIPLTVVMIMTTVLLSFVLAPDAGSVVAIFNSGFAASLGEFALILLPSFLLAAALGAHNLGGTGAVGPAAAPVAGAGMICPDTAYAALSPIAGRRQLETALGAYAGFKLLIPAGPLIVATGLGVDIWDVAWLGLALAIPVVLAGYIWGRTFGADDFGAGRSEDVRACGSWVLLRPFAAMLILLTIGASIDFSGSPMLEFLTGPKVALALAALVALSGLSSEQIQSSFDEAVRRTGSLLFIIGAASALGHVLVQLVPLEGLVPGSSGLLGVIGLFALSAALKIVQGSSMATFAAVTPLALPLVEHTQIDPGLAVIALCAGSIVAILPNDSFYWLVREGALKSESDARSILILSGGAVLQGLVALLGLVLLWTVAF